MSSADIYLYKYCSFMLIIRKFKKLIIQMKNLFNAKKALLNNANRTDLIIVT